MGREVRRVPADWQHPKNDRGTYVPLLDGKDYDRHVSRWDEGAAKWAEGLRTDFNFNGGWKPIDDDQKSKTFSEWWGDRPNADDYMPRWSDNERTHLMMYEDTSEGTPISPAFATPEELARWLADNNASAFGNQGASYEAWLPVCRGSWAPSMVVVGGRVMSGVEASIDP
jgi:hypothetical protein